MSIQPTANAATTVAAGLPAVNQALEPEWVRRGSPATQKAYQSALAFEQTFVEQLSKSLTDTSGLAGESSPEGESGSEGGSSAAGAGNSQLSSMLPQALTASVMNAGGLGMAAQMTRALEGVPSAAQTHASAGAAPVAATGVATADTTGSTGGAGS
jgi:Rod binding domain-containing protein